MTFPRPQPGPQTVLDECDADIVFYGGAAGGGKSWGLLYVGAKPVLHPEVRGYRGIVFRRTEPELTGGGGLWDKSQELYRAFGGRSRQSELDWTFEAGSGRIEHRHRIDLAHIQHENDVYGYHGQDFAYIAFDELQTFTAKQFWYMVSRLRSICGVRPHLRASCNPDPDSFVAEIIEWWLGPDGYPIEERCGVIRWFVRDEETDALDWYDTEAAARAAHPDKDPLSFTFIAAKLSDNVELTRQDPAYRGKLQAMNRVDRLRLLGEKDEHGRDRGGNWRVRATAGMFFPRAKFIRSRKPPSPIVRTVRFWDRAYTKPTPKHPQPDWTRGVRLSICEGGEFWWDDLISLRDRPAVVLEAMRTTAANDGVAVTVGTYCETGFAGKTDSATVEAILAGFDLVFIDVAGIDISKEGVAGARSSRAKLAIARAWTTPVELGRVYLAEADWTNEALAELDGFPDARFDDIPDAAGGAMHLLQTERATTMAEALKRARA